MQASSRLLIAIDGKAVRGAKNKDGKAPHLVAALAHGIGAVLGQVAVQEKYNENAAVRELVKAFADLAGAVFTMDAMHTQADTAQVILGRGHRLCDDRQGQHANVVPAAEEAALGRRSRGVGGEHRSRPQGPPLLGPAIVSVLECHTGAK